MSDSIFRRLFVGATTAADGTQPYGRATRTFEQAVSQVHGRYYEQAKRGNMFLAPVAVGGVAPGTALSTTPAYSIFNPGSSGVQIAILQVRMGYISGTLGAGSWIYSTAVDAAAPSGGTAITPVNCLIGASGVGQASVGINHTVDAATTTLGAIGWGNGPYLATTAIDHAQWVDYVDGAMVVDQGATWCIEFIGGGGSTPLVQLCVWYEEVPV